MQGSPPTAPLRGYASLPERRLEILEMGPWVPTPPPFRVTHDTCVLGWDIRLDKVVITFRVTVHTIPESQAGGSPRLVLRVPRGWGEAQAGDIRFYTLRYLSPRLGGSPRLVLRVPRGWGEAQAGDIRLNRLERIENYRTDRELYNV